MATERDRVFRATALKLGVFGTTMVLVFAGLVIVLLVGLSLWIMFSIHTVMMAK